MKNIHFDSGIAEAIDKEYFNITLYKAGVVVYSVTVGLNDYVKIVSKRKNIRTIVH